MLSLSFFSIPNFRNCCSICNLHIHFCPINILLSLSVTGQGDKEIISRQTFIDGNVKITFGQYVREYNYLFY